MSSSSRTQPAVHTIQGLCYQREYLITNPRTPQDSRSHSSRGPPLLGPSQLGRSVHARRAPIAMGAEQRRCDRRRVPRSTSPCSPPGTPVARAARHRRIRAGLPLAVRLPPAGGAKTGIAASEARRTRHIGSVQGSARGWKCVRSRRGRDSQTGRDRPRRPAWAGERPYGEACSEADVNVRDECSRALEEGQRGAV